MGREGVRRAEGNKGGKWDNCNSIINKIHLKNKNGYTQKQTKIDKLDFIKKEKPLYLKGHN